MVLKARAFKIFLVLNAHEFLFCFFCGSFCAMECRVLWWIFGGVAGVSPAEGVGENVTQSENFAFIVAEGETFPSQILKKILRCLRRKSAKKLPSQCSRFS
ncbi:MAG: hypothetical protein K2F89_05850, partial [Treponemataceae bacterium]|nr:hypothetical protein [Treponemataceae bacterium]